MYLNQKKSNRNKQIFELVFCSLLVALIIVLSLPPHIGFLLAIPFLGIQITILHIPVIIGAVLLGRKYAWVLGLAFGLGGWWGSFFLGLFLWQNPLISILPRLLFGMAAFEIFNLLKKVIKKDYLVFILTAVLATLTHTVLVMFAILTFGSSFYSGLDGFIQTILVPSLTLNMVVEIILAPLIGYPIYRAMQKLSQKELMNNKEPANKNN